MTGVQTCALPILIKNFYSYLKKGYSTDKALQLAKLQFLDHADMLRSHPYFWSPYIQIGNYSPVYFKRIYFFLAIVIIVLSAGGIILKKAKAKAKEDEEF